MNGFEQYCRLFCSEINMIKMFLWEFILNILIRLSKLETQDQDELKRELKHLKCGEMKHEL